MNHEEPASIPDWRNLLTGLIIMKQDKPSGNRPDGFGSRGSPVRIRPPRPSANPLMGNRSRRNSSNRALGVTNGLDTPDSARRFRGTAGREGTSRIGRSSGTDGSDTPDSARRFRGTAGREGTSRIGRSVSPMGWIHRKAPVGCAIRLCTVSFISCRRSCFSFDALVLGE